VSNLVPPRTPQNFGAAAVAAQQAREKHFPLWSRVVSAVVMGTGLAMMVVSATRPPGADALFMSGFALVMLDLAVVAWVLVHLPGRPVRAVHERTADEAGNSHANR
jgi:hypothetical protein